jgi:hypothetical protein
MKNSATLWLIIPVLHGAFLLANTNSTLTEHGPKVLALPSDSAASDNGSSPSSKPTQILFDDFNYSNYDELTKHGWIVRTEDGWPGLPGARWLKEGVSFLDDTDHPGNRILRMTSSTDGTGANTTQTQICHERKYLEGTYAARVRFSDDPVAGPAGDQLVESFYTISPLKAPMDPDYSELDFEYLPVGGWGVSGASLYATSWRTFSPEPNWKKDNVFNLAAGRRGGWHTLVTQVADGRVTYFIDGQKLAEHGGRYYPRSTMSLNIKEGTLKTNEVRRYTEDIDWIFHEAKVVLTPNQIEAKIAAMRAKSIRYQDTVPAHNPKLTSPCNF